MAGIGTVSPTADITTNPLAAAQLSTFYGPNTNQALRHSQYLADALRQLQSSGQDIKGGWGELGAKLLAQAILSRKNDQGQDALIKAMGADRDTESQTALAGLTPPSGAPQVPSGAISLPPEAAPQPAPEPAPPPPQASPSAQPASQYSAQDRDALTRMIATEAIGEGTDGMAAAGHVALNRLHSGYGGAKSLSDVIYQPHQFTGMARASLVSPEAYAKAGEVADGLLGGLIPDQTDGAMAFLNPELTQKLYGRIPAWAQGGDGHRIGNHVFFGGGRAQVAATDGYPPPPPPPGPNVPVEPALAAGIDPNASPPPSAPGTSSPPAAGTPLAGSPPQAPPAGGTAGWPKWKPSPDEVAYVTKLLNSPKDHAAGLALAQHYQMKMLEPEEAQITLINGVPFYIPKDPTRAAVTTPIPVPAAAMTQHVDGQASGAPPGTLIDQTPLGARSTVYKPPDGYQGDSHGLHYQPGGPADPSRPQQPAPGYRVTGETQAPIPGGPADPRSSMNVAAGAEKVQAAIRPTIDLARDARTSLGQVQAGYQMQNGAGDVAMLKGVSQLISHGVVRPADVDQQLKADGISGSLAELTGFLTSTGKLSPETRAKVAQAAQALYASANQQFKSQVLSHRATTDAIYGPGAFDKYVFPSQQAQDLGWADAPGNPKPPAPPAAQPQLTPGSREAAIAEAKRRGLLPK